MLHSNFHATSNSQIAKQLFFHRPIKHACRQASIWDDIMTLFPRKLESYVGEKGFKMSGGQKQLVAIARAVIARPELLLADEPTGNVDATIAVRLMYLLEELNKLGTTVLIATHNEDLVDRFGHPARKIDNGTMASYQKRAAVPADTAGR